MKAADLQRCVVLINPASTHAARSQQLADELRAHFSKFEIIETAASDYRRPEQLVKKLRGKLNDTTLLAVGGGDGTISLVVNLLLTDKELSKKASLTAILPLWGGNANDLAFMANGRSRNHLGDLLTKAKIAAVHPLAVTIHKPEDTQTRLAVCYASFGASAWVSELMNQPQFRQRHFRKIPGSRLLVEAVNSVRALMQAKPFSVEVDGQEQTLYDLILVNGPRIAKLYRLPVKMTDTHFLELRLRHKHPVFLGHLAKISNAWSSRRRPRKNEQSLIIRQATWAQFDGEPQEIPEGTTISVRAHPEPIHLLATKL